MWLLILLCTQQLAQLTWRWWPGLQTADRPVRLAPAAQVGQGPERLDLGPLQRLALFGKPEPRSGAAQGGELLPPEQVSLSAPKTKLNITLTGLLASTDPKRSIAIVAQGSNQASYLIGDKIDGTPAKLRAVLPDRIIIDNQGRDETLMLDTESATAPRSSMPPPPGRPQEENLSDLRDNINDNPAQLLDYITISPVREDNVLKGYRLNPGKKPELFGSLGLQPNDLALNINGYDLRDPAQAMQAMQQMKEVGQLEMTIERDGVQQSLSVSLQQ
ncbi:type II secretion system protein GspC [Pseudaeromonas paramecii]